MIFNELVEGHFFALGEVGRHVVMRGEHFAELKAAVLHCTRTVLHIWVSRWIEVKLDLVEIEGSITVLVKGSECLLDNV